MDRLVVLLNEFEKEKKSGFTWNNIDSYDNCVYGVDCDGETEITMYSDLYSKYYGFIKWLVEQDKIDLLRLDSRIALSEFNKVERVLMALSIQDNPIEFLVSILK